MISRIDEFLMQAYLNRELDAQTEADFEIELIRRPELARLMEADVALAIGLQEPNANVAPANAQASLQPASNRQTRARWLNWRIAAAITGFGVISGMVGFFAGQPRQASFGATQIAYVDKLRNANDRIEIQWPKASPLVLMVPVSKADCLADIDITQSDKKLSTKAKPDDFGFAAVLLGQAVLSKGTAQISVRCDEKLVGSYELELR
jgi:hypothetical protein